MPPGEATLLLKFFTLLLNFLPQVITKIFWYLLPIISTSPSKALQFSYQAHTLLIYLLLLTHHYLGFPSFSPLQITITLSGPNIT